MTRLTVEFEPAQVWTTVRDLASTLACRLRAAENALWLYTLFHRITMWCSLTRGGDTSDGPAGLLRDLDEMSR
jgi:hypothetical protein